MVWPLSSDKLKAPYIRDRSFFMREGGLVGFFFGGGPLEKNWLERGGQPKKMKERGGGGRTKKLD